MICRPLLIEINKYPDFFKLKEIEEIIPSEQGNVYRRRETSKSIIERQTENGLEKNARGYSMPDWISP